MATDTRFPRLSEEFPALPVEAWEALIQTDLKGADYAKKLVWRTEEGIAVKPYYTADDRENLPAGSPGAPPYVRGSGERWQGVPAGEQGPFAVDALPWHEGGATVVEELAFALAAGVEAVAAGAAPQDVNVRFGAGSNFFFEVAKPRAARLLWSAAMAAFGHPDACWRIHVQTAKSNKTLYDGYSNLIRATTEAMAAAIGGADSISVAAFRFDDRLAANVPLILREESHLDRVADPAGGSYYVEWLTAALAREAWKLFQEIETAGGWKSYEAAATARIEASRKAKEASVAARRRVLVGVNNYTDWKESVLGDLDGSELSEWRLAGPFESMRLRTERHVAAGGKRPVVLLLEAGDLKMRKARSAFCSNFFGCAGFETRETSTFEECDLCVLCSSDAEYLELAGTWVPQAGPVPVIVAGNPKEHVEALNQAGVAGYVHLFSNPVETLSAWQDRLGVKE